MNRIEAFTLTSGHALLSIGVSEWEVLCITLRLAKVFESSRALSLQTEGGQLTLNEFTQLLHHVEVVLLPAMETGDFLMPDLTLSDQAPHLAFLEGDPRRDRFLSRKTLDRLFFFAGEARQTTLIRRVRLD